MPINSSRFDSTWPMAVKRAQGHPSFPTSSPKVRAPIPSAPVHAMPCHAAVPLGRGGLCRSGSGPAERDGTGVASLPVPGSRQQRPRESPTTHQLSHFSPRRHPALGGVNPEITVNIDSCHVHMLTHYLCLTDRPGLSREAGEGKSCNSSFFARAKSPRRRLLLGILGFCIPAQQTPAAVSTLNQVGHVERPILAS